MSSVVYYRFKANIKTDSVPFDGSAISVKDLNHAIRIKCGLHSNDFDLKLEDSNGKNYIKDDELIPKYTSIVVSRVPKLTTETLKKKTIHEHVAWKDVSRFRIIEDAQPPVKHLNLADSDLPEEEKIRIMMERSSENYSEKHFSVKAKPYGTPPVGYICRKCKLPGHWIHNCPGVLDNTGKINDVKSVKHPTGIPQDFLLEVEAGTPGAYLDRSGKYMVPIKDAEAYAMGKKDKRPFSVEENPPYVPQEKSPPKHLICGLCKQLFRDAVLVSCCGTTFCNECIMDKVFDSGSHSCPNCKAVMKDQESSIFENTIARNMVRDWLSNEKSLFTTNQTEADMLKPCKPKQASQQTKTEVAVELLESNQIDSAKTDVSRTSPVTTVPMPSCEPSVLPSSNFIPSPHHSYTNPIIQNTNPILHVPSTCTTTVVETSLPSMPSVTSGIPGVPLDYLSSTTPNVVPGVIPPNANSGPNFLNTLFGVSVDSCQIPLVSQAALAGSLQPGWSLVQPLYPTITQSGLIVDDSVRAMTNPLSHSLVSGHATPGNYSDTVSSVDPGVKVLSREEFYRLKMDMLRKRRLRSRSRSPLRRRTRRHSSSRRRRPDLDYQDRRVRSTIRERLDRYNRDYEDRRRFTQANRFDHSPSRDRRIDHYYNPYERNTLPRHDRSYSKELIDERLRSPKILRDTNQDDEQFRATASSIDDRKSTADREPHIQTSFNKVNSPSPSTFDHVKKHRKYKKEKKHKHKKRHHKEHQIEAEFSPTSQLETNSQAPSGGVPNNPIPADPTATSQCIVKKKKGKKHKKHRKHKKDQKSLPLSLENLSADQLPISDAC